MDSTKFAEHFLLAEVVAMKNAGITLHLLASVIHGIESAGALSDNLPFKAKGQGRKRFVRTLNTLFPPQYAQANKQLDLYGQLRSHVSHCMLPAQSIFMVSDPKEHLRFHDGKLQVCLDSLYADYCAAISGLMVQLESGKLKQKKIQFKNLGAFLNSG